MAQAQTKNPMGYDLKLFKKIFQSGFGPEAARVEYKKRMEIRTMAETLSNGGKAS